MKRLWPGKGGQANQAAAAAAEAAVVRLPAPAELKRFGLENFGNTCYVNAIFQALYFCGPFRELVLAAADPVHDAEVASQPALFVNPPPTPAQARTPASPSPLALTAKSPSKSGAKRPTNGASAATPAAGAAGAPAASAEAQDTPGIPANPPTLFSALRSLFWYISQNPEDKGAVSPLAFVNKVRKEHDTFRSAAHQDAHEFMNYLLNKIGEELEAASRERERAAAAAAALAAADDLSNSLTASSGSQPRNHAKTFVHALFEGVLTSETRCLTCENVSSRDESFIDLSIDIEQNSSVTACLRSFSASEMLCQRNKFFCDACCGLQEAEKRMKIKKLPNVLALHLKRFKFQEEAGRYVKLAYRVAFASELRLFNTVDEPEGGDPDRLYELFAIVVHIGAGPHHGHYIAIVKTRGVWLVYDDNSVDTLKDDQISKYFGDGNGGSGYVLFYQAVDIDREALGLPLKPAPPASPQFVPTVPSPIPVSVLNGHMPTLTDSPPHMPNGLPPVAVAEDMPRTARPQPTLLIPAPAGTTAESTPTISNRNGFFRRPSVKIVHSPAVNGDSEAAPPVPSKPEVLSVRNSLIVDKDVKTDKEKEKDGKTGGWFRKSIRDKNRKSREASESATSTGTPRTPTGSAFADADMPPPTPQVPPEFARGATSPAPVGPPSAFLPTRRPSTDVRRGSLDTASHAPSPGHTQSVSYSHGHSQSISPHQSYASLGVASTLSSRSPSLPGTHRPPSLSAQPRSASGVPSIYALTPNPAESTTTVTTTITTSSSSSSAAPLVPPPPLLDSSTTRQRKNSGSRNPFQKLVDTVTPGTNSHALSDSEASSGRKRVTSAVFSPPPSTTTTFANGPVAPPKRSYSVAPPASTSAADFSFSAAAPAASEDIGASPKPLAKLPARKMSLTGQLRGMNPFASSKDKDKDRPAPVRENGHAF